jgi:hypothetical protein
VVFGPGLIEADDEQLWVTEPLPWKPRPGIWCRIWHQRPYEVQIDAAKLEALNELGYLGD